MTDFVQDSERTDDGKALKAMNTQGINAINQLKNIKINIVALKIKVDAGGVYTAEDSAKVQEVINLLLAEIATI